jgi:hypothetical protein
MKNILSIGHNELRLFMKSRTALLWLFVLDGLIFFHKPARHAVKFRE